MPDLVLRVRSPQQAAVARRLVAALAGREDFAPEIIKEIKLRVASVLLSLIQDDFITKARGGTGLDGIKWAPLKPSTIANRRLGPGDPKPKNQGRHPYLTKSLDAEWWKIYKARMGWIIAKWGYDPKSAKPIAAAMAWAAVKRMGGQTKLMALGGRVVEILRDTNRLFGSLSPGIESDDQVLRISSGTITVGSNVEYAARQHAMRPFWPTNGQLPEAYKQPILDALRTGILESVIQLSSR